MDRVYSGSAFTAAILSHVLSNQEDLDAFAEFMGPLWYAVHVQKKDLAAMKEIMSRTRSFLLDIAENAWFRRSWTFQEKWCGAKLHYLLTLRCVVRGGDLQCVGEDLFFSVKAMQAALARCTSWVGKKFKTDLRQTVHTDVPLLPFGSVWGIPGTTSSRNPEWDKFRVLETCDNLVVSDRLAIFANVNGFQMQLKSTVLNRAAYSYSTCILVLLLRNAKGRARSYLRPKVGQMDLTLNDVLKGFRWRVRMDERILQHRKFRD
jgi:hypothetical protein